MPELEISSGAVCTIKETCSSMKFNGEGLWVFNPEVFLNCCVLLKHTSSGLFLFGKRCASGTRRVPSVNS